MTLSLVQLKKNGDVFIKFYEANVYFVFFQLIEIIFQNLKND